MTSAGFVHVTTEELRSHAESIDKVSESLDLSAEAAAEKRMGGMIYGVLFDFTVLPLLNMWADHLHTSITYEAELGSTIAEGVRTNAQLYDNTEAEAKAKIVKSGNEGGE
jgi:hypothetical protein